MYVLGIETSCDETAVAVTEGDRILASSVSSSVHLHKKFGGVVPEIACRHHVEYINFVLKNSLRRSGVGLDDIGLVAVTARPGLVGALLVGISMAKAISLAKAIPLVGVDHLAAHLYAAHMEQKNVRFPYIGMVASGGHTSLLRQDSVLDYMLLGQTADDAAGEAFDKVAKLLGLGYPGGPAIQKTARIGKVDKRLFRVYPPDLGPDFSFSGVKTAVLYYARDNIKKYNRQMTASVAASFQDAVTDTLTEKAIEACRRERINRLVLGGGVCANAVLRKKMSMAARQSGIRLYIPSIKLCGDNAAMVAGLGYALYKKGVRSDMYLTADSDSVFSKRKRGGYG